MKKRVKIKYMGLSLVVSGECFKDLFILNSAKIFSDWFDITPYLKEWQYIEMVQLADYDVYKKVC